MDRVAVFVDAGYLFAAGSALICGRVLRRSELRLDEPAAIMFLTQLAQATANLPLLRIYWYDGTNAGPTPAQTSLANRANVKVRLGLVNAAGEQKGVDSLIVTDMINLSRNRAMSDALLVTGDEDIRVGVQQAQELGVRVHLVGIANAEHNQSNLLRQEADTLHEMSKPDVDTFLARAVVPAVVVVPAAATPVAPVPAAAPVVAGASLAAIATAMAANLSKQDSDRVVNDGRGVPPDLDRGLLKAGRDMKGSTLEEHEKRELRRVFIDCCRTRQ